MNLVGTPCAKFSSNRSEVFTVDRAIDELRQESQKRTSASFSFNPKEKGMTTVGEEDKVTSTVAKQPNLRKRRMSIIHYKKEQSLVVILAMVTFMFTISTIPSSIILIFKYLQHEETNGNATFEVIKSLFIFSIMIKNYPYYFIFDRTSKLLPTCWS